MRYRRAAQALAVAGVALVAAAPMAAAHVSIDPGEAEQGGYATLDIRVPSESDTASTTQLEVNLPTETPIRSVRVQPKPGWEYEIERTELDEPIESGHGEPVTEVVSKITWTGGEIGPGEFDQFPVSVGPLPEDVDELLFPTVQTYSDGEARRWIEEGEDVESPAPSLTLTPAAEEGDAAADEESAAAGGESASSATAEGAASEDDVDSASTLGTVGIVVGVIGVLVGGFALVRTRSAPAATTAGGEPGA